LAGYEDDSPFAPRVTFQARSLYLFVSISPLILI
jgi:hypothetical protein